MGSSSRARPISLPVGVGSMAVISVARVNGRTLVRVVGDIDVASAPKLAEALAILDGPLTVDCSRLDFIDASGLGVLVRASHDHEGFLLRNASPFLHKLVEITGLQSTLHLVEPARVKVGTP
jgi:anti-anti-sigma factor